jgi:hypothetical protein
MSHSHDKDKFASDRVAVSWLKAGRPQDKHQIISVDIEIIRRMSCVRESFHAGRSLFPQFISAVQKN